jgi:hypothetical protein
VGRLKAAEVEQQLALVTKPPVGTDAFPVTNEAFQVTVEMDLDAFYTRMLNETRTALSEFQKQGLEGEELANAVESRLQNLSDKPIERMGEEATSEAFNLGRNIEAQSQLPKLKEAVRTEILDVATCLPCRLLDGTRVELNSEEYFELMPPNQCLGRHRCRGFYLYRTRDAA